VLPRDAVAGVPADYAEAVLANTLGIVATITTTPDVVGAWGGDADEADRMGGAGGADQ
jgi:biuret amidohydrolase